MSAPGTKADHLQLGGGVDRGVLTVLLDEFVGGAVDRQGRQIACPTKYVTDKI